MPRYEFLCRKCEKPFELILLIRRIRSGDEKEDQAPKMQEHGSRATNFRC